MSIQTRSKNSSYLQNIHVRVNFDYRYKHKSKLIHMYKGEILELLQKTDEHWWKCLRAGQAKSFYVPALYVSVIEHKNIESASSSNLRYDEVNSSTSCLTKIDGTYQEELPNQIVYSGHGESTTVFNNPDFKADQANGTVENIIENPVTDMHLKFAKIFYEQEMEKQTSSSSYLIENELHQKHSLSVKITLEKLLEIEQFSSNQKENVNLHLDKLLPQYVEINSKKKIEGPAIGIDLGTTYSCVSILRNNGKLEIIPNEVGSNKSPSYVAFHLNEGEEDDGDEKSEEEIVCGQTAKELAHEFPLTTIFDIKRMIGRSYYDSRIQSDKTYWPFQIESEYEEIKVKTGKDSTKSPLELTSTFLEHLKKTADTYLNTEVVKVVVAVPAYYTPAQLELIREACKFANIICG